MSSKNIADQPQGLSTLIYASMGLCALAYGFVLLLIGGLSLYAVPMADDFCYANKALQHGALGAVLDEYNTWSGRYSSTFLMAWFTLNVDLVQQYWLITLTTMAVLLGGLLSFLWVLFGRISWALFLTLPLSVVLILALPKPGEVLFWLAGATTYGFGMGVMMFWMAFVTAILKHQRGWSPMLLGLGAIAVGLAIILPGFQESIMTMVIAFAGLAVVASLWLKRHWSVVGVLGLVLVAAFVLGLVVVQNPGAAIRSSNHDLAGNLPITFIVMILLTLVSLVLSVPAQLGVWASGLGICALWSRQDAPHGGTMCHANGEISAATFVPGIVIGTVLVLAAGNLPPAWGIGGPPSPRALTPQLVFGFIAVLILLVRLGPSLRRHANKLNLSLKVRRKMLAGILTLHALAVFSSDFMGAAVTNLVIGGRTPAANYNAEWSERYAAINNAKTQGIEELALPPLQNRPSLLMVTDIGSRGSWVSNCFSGYWGLDVYVQP